MIASGAKYLLIEDMPWYVVIVPIAFSVLALLLVVSYFLGKRGTGKEPK